MKLLISMLLLFVPLSVVNAQNWTAEEQEVIDFIERCQSMNWSADYDAWFDECWDEDIVYVDPEFSPTSSIDRSFVKQVRPLVRKGVTDRHLNMTPMSVKVHGDVAVIYYFVEGIEEMNTGELFRWKGYSSETVIKRDGAWKVINKNDWPFPGGSDG